MHYNATKSGVDILEKLVREKTCTRSIWCWPLTLFLNLTDVACVNVLVLWMLKYSNWQQKKNNNQRCLHLLSLVEEMVTPHIRRAGSGNVDRRTRRVMRAMGVACKQAASPTTVKKNRGRWCVKCCICPTAKYRKTDWKCCQCSEWVCEDHSIKTIQITYNCKEHSYKGQISFTFMF